MPRWQTNIVVELCDDTAAQGEQLTDDDLTTILTDDTESDVTETNTWTPEAAET